MALASRGLRDLDRGREVIASAAEFAQVRRQARKVHIESVIAAALATGVLLAAFS